MNIQDNYLKNKKNIFFSENKVVKNEGNSYRAFVLVTFDVSNWSPPVKITQVDQGALDAEIAGSDVIQ